MIHVLDVAGTSEGAERLLVRRVQHINRLPGILNAIACPRGVGSDRVARQVPTHEFEMGRALNAKSLLSEVGAVRTILRRFRPDVLHTHSSKGGAVGRLAAIAVRGRGGHRLRIVHQVHGFHFLALRGISRVLYLLVEVVLAAVSDELLFQTRRELRYAKGVGLGALATLSFIGNGIDLSKAERAACPLGEAPDARRIVCVARLEAVKNHAMLVRVIARVKRLRPALRFSLVLIGEGPGHEILGLARAYGVDGHVQFSGRMTHDETLAQLALADVSVLSSIKEGLPRALMESAALGVPCVGTRVNGISEVIVDGHTGFLVPLGDDAAFADRILRILESDEAASRLRANALEFARNEFDEDAVIHRLVARYRALLGRKPATAD